MRAVLTKSIQRKKKFDILRDILKKFINQRYDDNVGVTIFGSYAFSAVPLTYDMKKIGRAHV